MERLFTLFRQTFVKIHDDREVSRLRIVSHRNGRKP